MHTLEHPGNSCPLFAGHGTSDVQCIPGSCREMMCNVLFIHVFHVKHDMDCCATLHEAGRA